MCHCPNTFHSHCTSPPLCDSQLLECLLRNTKGSRQLFLLKKIIKCINMSLGVNHCTKSSVLMGHRVIQSIYFEALQHLVPSDEQRQTTAQKDSYRSERGCRMFEGEVPWKAPLTSSASFQLLLLIHWCLRRKGRH